MPPSTLTPQSPAPSLSSLTHAAHLQLGPRAASTRIRCISQESPQRSVKTRVAKRWLRQGLMFANVGRVGERRSEGMRGSSRRCLRNSVFPPHNASTPDPSPHAPLTPLAQRLYDIVHPPHHPATISPGVQLTRANEVAHSLGRTVLERCDAPSRLSHRS